MHVGVDADGFIAAAALTDAATGDASVVPDLIDHLDAPIASFTADGAYDGRAVYESVLWAGPAPKIVIAPKRTAVVAGSSEPMLAQRDAAIELIRQAGRRRWPAKC